MTGVQGPAKGGTSVRQNTAETVAAMMRSSCSRPSRADGGVDAGEVTQGRRGHVQRPALSTKRQLNLK